MSQDNNATTLEKELESAPKYGRNAAWILLKALADEEEGKELADATASVSKQPDKTSRKAGAQSGPSGYVKVDMALFEAMPKVLRPNIEVNRRAKIPRGPRITWLNRSIAIYLKFIGCEILKLEAGAPLVQEVKFNASLCRCAIAAAQAHEADAFASYANATRYHAAMMRKHPSLDFLPHDRLAPLCVRYGQPCPELPAAAGTQQPATQAHADPDSAEPIRADKEAASPSTTPADHAKRADSGPAEVQTEGRPDMGVAGASGTCVDRYSEQKSDHDDLKGDAAALDAGASRRAAADGEGGVDELFRELFGDDGDAAAEAHSAPAGVDQPAGCSAEGEASRDDCDKQREAVEGVAAEEDGSAGKPGSDALNKEATEGDEDEPGEPCEPHPDDDFQEFVRERKRAKRQHSEDGRDSGGVEAPAGGGGAGVGGQARLEVQKYVGELLEPWLKGGSIDVRQYTDILGRVVEKVIGAHADAGDAGFLERHASSIRKLVDRYVKFTLKR